MADFKTIVAVYADLFANFISGGRMNQRDKMSALGIKTDFNKIITKKSITKVWCVIQMPVHFSANISEAIRHEMFAAFPDVRTMIQTYNSPAKVNVKNRNFQHQYKSAAEAYNKYKEVFDSLDEEDQHMGKTFEVGGGKKFSVNSKALEQIRDRRDSFAYVYDTCTSGGYFTETYYFIHASAATVSRLEAYERKLLGFLEQNEISVVEITREMSKYLTNFGPASEKTEDLRKAVPMLLSDECLASMMPYRTKGLIGGSGLLLGEDWLSRQPFMVNLMESSAAQVVMVCGKAGSGKTYTCFPITEEAAGIGIHSSALDVKGNEWNKLGAFLNMKEIAIGEPNSPFVNTMRLDDLKTTSANCEDLFNFAISSTVSLLALMTNLAPTEGNKADLNSILDKACMKYMTQLGVNSKNPNTFSRTKNARYDELLEVIRDLKDTKSYTPEKIKICDLVLSRCSQFFIAEGRYYEMFRNEITVGEILDNELIVYSLGKNAGAEMDSMDSIKIFMMQVLDSKKHEIRKQQHKHTIAFYEELQRCENSEILINYIQSRVTGSRSSNVTIFLLLNAITAFKNQALSQIRSNITTKIIGKVNTEDIKTLVEDFECGAIEDYLHMINDPDSDEFNNCFAIQYDTGFNQDKAIFKAILPQYMWEAFNTRDRLVFE